MAEPLDTYCEFMEAVPDRYEPAVRELLAWDVQSSRSCGFVRREHSGAFAFKCDPAPLHWSRVYEWPWVLERGDFAQGQRVLEVAGGHTILKFALAKRVGQVVCSEYESCYMPAVQADVDLLGSGNITLVHADARDLPFPDNWFDRVVCVSTLEHIPDGRHEALAEMVRVVKSGGLLLVTMDIRLEGEATDNWFVDMDEASQLMGMLGITGPINQLTVTGELPGGIVLAVLLSRYRKPEV